VDHSEARALDDGRITATQDYTADNTLLNESVETSKMICSFVKTTEDEKTSVRATRTHVVVVPRRLPARVAALASLKLGLETRVSSFSGT
jgi:hypothetical protein